MEGFTLLRTLRELLNEASTSSFLNDRTSYSYLWTAVQDFNFRTHYLTANQTVSVVAGVNAYNLNPDYVGMALLDSYNRPAIKHTYGGSDTFLYNAEYASIVLQNSTATATVADSYAITDAAQPANLTGTATSAGAASGNGECTLTDTAANFSTLYPGDFVHNTTQGTDGIVVALVSSTQVVCALFSDGTAGSAWAQNDAYVIVPQPKYSLVLTPIPSDAATVTVPYIKRPDPVFSLYRAYKLPFDYLMPIAQFAAFLYKYRDSAPNYGDAFYKYYDAFSRKKAAEMRRSSPEKQGFRCNFRKVNARSRSMGNWSR